MTNLNPNRIAVVTANRTSGGPTPDGHPEDRAITAMASSAQPATLDGNEMSPSRWIVRLFGVSDVNVQQAILEILNEVVDIVALGRLIGRDAYIAVETMDDAQATAARKLIMAIDPDARVLDTARRHPDPGS